MFQKGLSKVDLVDWECGNQRRTEINIRSIFFTVLLAGAFLRGSSFAAASPEPTLSGFSITPSEVEGGKPVKGRIELSDKAPTDMVVTFASGGKNMTGEKTATVPKGAGFVIITHETKVVTHIEKILVSATLGAVTKTATLILDPVPLALTFPTLTGFSIDPAEVQGGSPAKGRIELSARAPADVLVTLSSDSKDVYGEKTVTIPAGKDFVIITGNTKPVAKAESVKIRATIGDMTKTATLVLNPVLPKLASLTLDPATVQRDAGLAGQGKVTLGSPAPAGGVVVNLDPGDKAIAFIPAGTGQGNTRPAAIKTITVPAGADSAVFGIWVEPGGPVKTSTMELSANLGGATKHAKLTLKHMPTVDSLCLTGMFDDDGLNSMPQQKTSCGAAIPVTGGGSVQGTVTLIETVPTGNQVDVILNTVSDNAAVPVPSNAVPSKLTVPAGQKSASFSFKTPAVNSAANWNITSVTGSESRPTMIGIIPPYIKSLYREPNELVAGSDKVTFTLTLTGPAPSNYKPVAITVRGAGEESLGSHYDFRFTVPEGKTRVTFDYYKDCFANGQYQFTASGLGSRSVDVPIVSDGEKHQSKQRICPGVVAAVRG